MSANPNLAATSYSSPDNPVTVATIAALMAQGWGPPEFSKINPAFSSPNGGTLVAGILLSDNDGNAQLVSENAQQLMRTVTYFNLPNDVTITVDGALAILYPQGSVMVLEADNGPSAYTPPAPAPTILKLVFGMFYGCYPFSDGVARNMWTAFNGTTRLPSTQPFYDAATNIENPTVGVQPIPGIYQILQGGFVVQLTNPQTGAVTAALPITG